MTIFENYFKNKSIDEIAEWFDEYGTYDGAPHIRFWDENYCKKCELVEAYVAEFGDMYDCAWCELNGNKCRFFQEMDEMPSNKQIIKMWLESEFK